MFSLHRRSCLSEVSLSFLLSLITFTFSNLFLPSMVSFVTHISVLKTTQTDLPYHNRKALYVVLSKDAHKKAGQIVTLTNKLIAETSQHNSENI